MSKQDFKISLEDISAPKRISKRSQPAQNKLGFILFFEKDGKYYSEDISTISNKDFIRWCEQVCPMLDLSIEKFNSIATKMETYAKAVQMASNGMKISKGKKE